MNDTLDKKVKEWLDKHGYPLEMHVAAAFQDAGFDVVQSIYYIDKDTNTPRELDVFAYANFQIESNYLSFAFPIECKISNKPWVAFLTNDRTYEINSQILLSTKGARQLINKLQENPKFKNPLFHREMQTYAYSLTQALRDGDAPDLTYKAVQTVLKSTESYITKFDSQSGKHFYFYFPLIVIDCALVEARLKADNEIDIKSTESATYLARNPRENSITSIIKIIKKEHVKQFAFQQYQYCQELVNDYEGQIKTFLKSLK